MRTTVASAPSAAIVAACSLTVLINSSLGWRDCCFLVGGLGLATAALAQLLVVEQPRKSAHEAGGSGGGGGGAAGAPATSAADGKALVAAPANFGETLRTVS
jgi:predicted MFS family arabinose efflux permease